MLDGVYETMLLLCGTWSKCKSLLAIYEQVSAGAGAGAVYYFFIVSGLPSSISSSRAKYTTTCTAVVRRAGGEEGCGVFAVVFVFFSLQIGT